MMQKAKHQWRFFKAGGFDQPLINAVPDLIALKHLDQKLWATLACPTAGLDLSAKFLALIDTNNDGRIRAPEVCALVDWVLARLAKPEVLFKAPGLSLEDLSADADNQALRLAFQRLQSLLGRTAEAPLSALDSDDLSVIFPPQAANGDGLIPPEFAPNAELQALLENIIACLGGELDRSGLLGASAATITEFFAQVRALQAWQHAAPELIQTPAALALFAELQDKINDFFTRAELIQYDARAAALMAVAEEDLKHLSGLNLADLSALESLPLANLAQPELPFTQGVNPAWQARLNEFYRLWVEPTLGAQERLTKAQWLELVAQVQPYFTWQAQQPANQLLATQALADVVALDADTLEAQLQALVEQDLEVAQAAQGWVDLDKLLNCQAYLIRFLNNFVAFSDFYSRGKGTAIFQAGRLFIDGKSCDLVINVNDVEAHSKIATLSNCFLIYCKCSRLEADGLKQRNIVALISAGAEHELMLGRNGLFYDNQGQDWDATIVKVVESAISVREAFFSPYKRVANMISEQIQKFAASKDSELLSKASTEVSAAGKEFDIAKFAGIFAAIGLALGAMGAALAATMSGLLALAWWQWPLVLLGLVAVISGPSMLMAWFKLRQRSLGPLLDANGWAVNAKARIGIKFGASLTQLALLPRGSAKSLKDPYASGHRVTWLLCLLAASVLLAAYVWLSPVS